MDTPDPFQEATNYLGDLERAFDRITAKEEGYTFGFGREEDGVLVEVRDTPFTEHGTDEAIVTGLAEVIAAVSGVVGDPSLLSADQRSQLSKRFKPYQLLASIRGFQKDPGLWPPLNADLQPLGEWFAQL